jgi:hypothetical protein
MPASLNPGSNQASGGRTREYLFDMIQQLARLARRSDEMAVAIHLEAILAAHLHDEKKGLDESLSR